MNLRYAPDLAEREAIALCDTGHAPDRDSFAAALARQFDTELERWRHYGHAHVIARWLQCAHPAGTPLQVHDSSGTSVSGEFAGLDPTGSLQLLLADGSMRVIHAGDVTLASGRK